MNNRRICLAAKLALFVAVALMPALAQKATAQNFCCLPPGAISFSVLAGSNSYAPITFSGIPGGYSVTNGTYYGWCVQYSVLIEKGPVYQGELYDAVSPTLPPALAEPWDKVAYILNHKQGDAAEVQNAIWTILGQSYDPPFTTNSQTMVDDATAFGSGFAPTNGQAGIVIVDPMDPVQRIICEVELTGAATNPPVVITLSSPMHVSGNQFQFQLNATPNHTYVIECSTNLVQWDELSTVTNPTGTLTFTDPNPATQTAKFYRAKLQ